MRPVEVSVSRRQKTKQARIMGVVELRKHFGNFPWWPGRTKRILVPNRSVQALNQGRSRTRLSQVLNIKKLIEVARISCFRWLESSLGYPKWTQLFNGNFSVWDTSISFLMHKTLLWAKGVHAWHCYLCNHSNSSSHCHCLKGCQYESL